MLKGAREVRLDWPVCRLRDAIIAANLTEPTQEMVLANSLQRQALTASSSEAGLSGRIRKIIGSVEESMDSSSCCEQQCALGRSARRLGRAICAQPRADEPFSPRLPPANMRRLALDAAGTSSDFRFGAGGRH